MILTKNSPWLRWMLLGGIVLTIAPAGAARRKPHNPPPAGDPGIPHAAADRVGFVQTLEGQTLHLSADLGTVHIFTLEPGAAPMVDRKSTRLNSSHGYISYAVFCLKKKKTVDRGTT